VGPPPQIKYADLGNLWANPDHEGDARMKTIYRGDYDGLSGVHRPKPPARTEISEELALYHIVNTVHGRYHQMTADAAPVSIL